MSSMFLDEGNPATGMKVMLATPVYEDPSAAYTFSISRTREALHKAGIQTAYLLLSGNCHVDDARNSVVQEFLLTDCTDLIFLDSDVCWEPEELIKLCSFDADIVGGIYPYRRSDEEGKESMPLVMYPGEQKPDENGLLEVAGLPTGFMRIRRSVLESLCKDADHFWKKKDRRSQVPILFERTFLEGVRLGGDLNFCRKWILKGGKVHAATDIHLGHGASSIVYDSLGAYLRRKDGSTIKHMADSLRSGDYDLNVFAEIRRAYPNKWAALEDVLLTSAVMAAKADGPIIEAGSGMTSIVLAASTKHHVYSLEHDEEWAKKTEEYARLAGVENLTVFRCQIKDGWYEIPEDLPAYFAFGLNDGPPRVMASRMGFFHYFGEVQNILCDDADDPGYRYSLEEWAEANNRRIDFVDRAGIIRPKELRKAA